MRSIRFGSLIILLLAVALLGAPSNAAPTASIELNPTVDIYVNRVNPNGNYENGLLFLQQNLTGSADADIVALLKFDLSGVTFPVTNVQLTMAAIFDTGVCNLQSVDEQTIELWRTTSDNWTGASTWNTAGGFGLRDGTAAMLGQDDPDYLPPTELTWTGNSGGDFVQYVEQERTGDDVLSIWVQLAGTGGSTMYFEDTDGSGANAGCTGATIRPTLLLSDEPLAVTLASFDATAGRDHVVLTWETTSEVNNLGFNLYRSSASAESWTQVNDQMIPSLGPGQTGGHVYTWTDDQVAVGETYTYRLEAVSTAGIAQTIGTASVTVVQSLLRIWLPLITH